MDLKKTLAVILLAALTLMAVGCGDGGKTPVSGEYAIKDDSLKAAERIDDNDLVFYEIFVGSFSDSDGDGTGDLRGIINRMDYLNDGDPDSGLSLGVEGLWLSPIFQSSSYHKYDVNDYYKIDSKFGTMDDLKELVSLCHERGVKVILDLVINHTGRGNAWFTQFCNAHQRNDTLSEYYDFYSWYDGDSEFAPAGRRFKAVPGTNHFYECNFSDDMPELNFDSESVRSTVVDIAKYYIDLGVDGFRFDAAKYVYFGDHERSLDFWLEYMAKLRAIKPDIYTVAEVWDGDGITNIYYPAMNCFDFTLSQTNGLIAETAKKGDVNKYTAYVEEYLRTVKAMREDAAIAPFITNHDMDRAAGFLTAASGNMQMAANLYILGPGTPFIYYGEELGMRGSRGGANTDANRRLAMLWGDGDTVRDPVGANYSSENQVETTAEEQRMSENSLYTYYKRLLMVRRANPEIARGEYTSLDLEGTKVGGFISEYNGSRVLVIHNTTLSSQTIDLSAISGIDVTELCAVVGMEDAALEGNTLTIGSQTSAVLR